MARILNTTKYPIVSVPATDDYIIGTDKSNSKRTRNFLVGDLLSLLSGTGLQNGLLSGAVTWQSGLTFEVSELTYILNQQFLTSDGGTVTLAAADPTNPRIDLIIVDVDGNVSSVTGTPAADPQKPVITDNSQQLELTFVTVDAAATEPTGVAEELVYAENVGSPTEWDATENTSGARINLASTTEPQAGSNHIAVSSPNDADKITFTADAAVVSANMSSLQFQINLQNTPVVGTKILLRFYNGATLASDTITVQDGLYGLDGTDTGNYQSIIVPMSAFTFNEGEVTILEMEFEGFGTGTTNTYIDQVRIVTGLAETTVDPGVSGTFNPLIVDNVGASNYPTQSGTGFYYTVGKLTFIEMVFTGLGTATTPGVALKISGLPAFIGASTARFSLTTRFLGWPSGTDYYGIEPALSGTDMFFDVRPTADGNATSQLTSLAFTAGSIKISGVIHNI